MRVVLEIAVSANSPVTIDSSTFSLTMFHLCPSRHEIAPLPWEADVDWAAVLAEGEEEGDGLSEASLSEDSAEWSDQSHDGETVDITSVVGVRAAAPDSEEPLAQRDGGRPQLLNTAANVCNLVPKDSEDDKGDTRSSIPAVMGCSAGSAHQAVQRQLNPAMAGSLSKMLEDPCRTLVGVDETTKALGYIVVSATAAQLFSHTDADFWAH